MIVGGIGLALGASFSVACAPSEEEVDVADPHLESRPADGPRTVKALPGPQNDVLFRIVAMKERDVGGLNARTYVRYEPVAHQYLVDLALETDDGGRIWRDIVGPVNEVSELVSRSGGVSFSGTTETGANAHSNFSANVTFAQPKSGSTPDRAITVAYNIAGWSASTEPVDHTAAQDQASTFEQRVLAVETAEDEFKAPFSCRLFFVTKPDTGKAGVLLSVRRADVEKATPPPKSFDLGIDTELVSTSTLSVKGSTLALTIGERTYQVSLNTGLVGWLTGGTPDEVTVTPQSSSSSPSP